MVHLKIFLNTQTLKVEKENAKALTEGFLKESKRFYSSIFTSHQKAVSMQKNFREFPKLLTAFRGNPRPMYPLSSVGLDLYCKQYSLRGKYVAVLDRIFHIKNDIRIWEQLCNGGIFDIWLPEAPYNSLMDEGTFLDKNDQMVLLLRIFEIAYDFTEEIIYGRYSDSIQYSRIVNVVKPIIPNNELSVFSKGYDGAYYFEDIINKIRSAVSGYLRQEEIVFDTSKIYLEEMSKMLVGK